MSTPIKLRALQRLAEILEREVSPLRGKVCAGPAGREHTKKFPSLAIIATRAVFESCQPDDWDYVRDELREPTPNTVVSWVGDWTIDLTLELGAATAAERYHLEHLIEQVFLRGVSGCDARWRDVGAEIRPGTLLVDCGIECWNARIAYLLNEDTWNNEMAFSQEWYSVLRVTCEVPAFVPRSAYTLTDLRLTLALNPDLDTFVVGDPLPTDQQTFAVASDGTVTEA